MPRHLLEEFRTIADSVHPELYKSIIQSEQDRTQASIDSLEKILETHLAGILPFKDPILSAFLEFHLKNIASRAFSALCFENADAVIQAYVSADKSKRQVFAYLPRHISRLDLTVGRASVRYMNRRMASEGIKRKVSRIPLTPSFDWINAVPVVNRVVRSSGLIPNQRSLRNPFYRNIWGGYFVSVASRNDILAFIEGTRTRTGEHGQFHREFLSYLLISQALDSNAEINLVPTGFGFLSPDGPTLSEITEESYTGQDTSQNFYRKEILPMAYIYINPFLPKGRFGAATIRYSTPLKLNNYIPELNYSKEDIISALTSRKGNCWKSILDISGELSERVRQAVRQADPVLASQLLCKTILPYQVEAGLYSCPLSGLVEGILETRKNMLNENLNLDSLPDNSESIIQASIDELRLYRVKTTYEKDAKEGAHLVVKSKPKIIEYVAKLSD